MKEKEIEITIKPDGTVDFDQIGWEGKGCNKAIDDLLKLLGGTVKSKKKAEFFKKVKIEQKNKRKI